MTRVQSPIGHLCMKKAIVMFDKKSWPSFRLRKRLLESDNLWLKRYTKRRLCPTSLWCHRPANNMNTGNANKELMAFLKIAWKEPTAEMQGIWCVQSISLPRRKLSCNYWFPVWSPWLQRNVLLVWLVTITRGPEYACKDKTHEDFKRRTPLRMQMHTFLSISCSASKPWSCSSQFWCQQCLLECWVVRGCCHTHTAPELMQFGLVKPGTLYQRTKACNGLRQALRLWEEARDKTLCHVMCLHVWISWRCLQPETKCISSKPLVCGESSKCR